MDFTKITVFCLFALQARFVRVVEATGCDDNNPQSVYYIRCTFPLNVNITRKEFTVYYKADDGGTGSLVDCRWPGSTFFCFKPEGVDCVPPVSDRVNITVSGRLACMHATFSAKVFGNVDSSSGTCEKTTLSDRPTSVVSPLTEAYTPSTKTSEVSTTGVIVGVLAAVIVIVIVIAILGTAFYIKRNKDKVTQWKCLKLLYRQVPIREPEQV